MTIQETIGNDHLVPRTWKRTNRMLRGITASSVVALLAGCGVSGVVQSEETATVRQALGAQTPSALAIPVPSGVDIYSTSILASNSIVLSDRVTVAGGIASVGSGSDSIEIGSSAVVGSTFSDGNVTLRNNATVNGNLTASGTISLDDSVTVSGTTTASAPVQPTLYLSWTVPPPGTNLDELSTEPDTTKDASPGKYTKGSIKARSSLTLHTGIYYFDTLTIESGARLLIDDSKGPVQIYVAESFTYRGEVRPATYGIPKLLVGVLGTGGAAIEAPFTGVVVAPGGDIRVQAQPAGVHHATFYGAKVRLEPDVKVSAYWFDWARIAGSDHGSGSGTDGGSTGGTGGPSLNPDLPDIAPHRMTISKVDQKLAVNVNGIGATTSTSSPGRVIDFTLPDSYSVDGGLIANGTVRLIYQSTDGTSVTCTYQGQSSTAAPTTQEDLINSRILNLVSCSDGQPASAVRHGTTFTTTITPAPGLPVTVGTPMREIGACHETVEIISARQTAKLKKDFKWSSVKNVAEKNGNDPALYYAWIYIKNRQDQLNLKKLWIHQLSRPLFTTELEAMAGKCGTFVNPGDGDGYMVPVLIPGKTYNSLKAVQSRDDISGDKTIFEAVILRDVPAQARNSNGSIKLDLLKDSGFVYLPYEPRPLPASNDVQLDSGAAKALVSAVDWVGGAVKDVGEWCTNALGWLDRQLRGSVDMTLQVSSIVSDASFTSDDAPYPIMIRAWGADAQKKLGAPGMQVSVLQKFLGSFIPATSMGTTNGDGVVPISAIDGGSIRGDTGLCIELSNDAAKIVGDALFHLPQEVCDFRAFTSSSDEKAPADFKLEIKPGPQTIHIENTMLQGFYQADDVYRYAQKALAMDAKQARIVTGYWADTMAPSMQRADGKKTMFAPCLNYPNLLSEAALAAGMLGGSVAGGVLAGPLGDAIGGLTAAYITTHIGNADIVIPANNNIPESREVMSHEMGHYMFCSMLHESSPDAVNWLIVSTIINGGTDSPIRYLNEAMADFFAGQVTGGADYDWGKKLANFQRKGEWANWCAPQYNGVKKDDEPRCWETNITAVADGDKQPGSIGRIATMLYDLADDHNAPRNDSKVAQRGDVWRWTDNKVNRFPLVYSESPYLKPDFENVTMGPYAIRLLSHQIAGRLTTLDLIKRAVAQLGAVPLNKIGEIADARTSLEADMRLAIVDATIYRAVNDVMKPNYSWCDRCALLATHKAGGDAAKDWSPELFDDCANDPLIAGALQEAPPDPNLNFERTTCTACPAGTVRNADYSQCVPCDGIVEGDQCLQCPADIVVDGTKLGVDTMLKHPSNSAQATDDTCPGVLWVEIRNVDKMFKSSGIDVLTGAATWSTNDSANCKRKHTLYTGIQEGSEPFVDGTIEGSGTWVGSVDGSLSTRCSGTPALTILPKSTATAVRFGVRANGADDLSIVMAASGGAH